MRKSYEEYARDYINLMSASIDTAMREIQNLTPFPLEPDADKLHYLHYYASQILSCTPKLETAHKLYKRAMTVKYNEHRLSDVCLYKELCEEIRGEHHEEGTLIEPLEPACVEDMTATAPERYDPWGSLQRKDSTKWHGLYDAHRGSFHNYDHYFFDTYQEALAWFNTMYPYPLRPKKVGITNDIRVG